MEFFFFKSLASFFWKLRFFFFFWKFLLVIPPYFFYFIFFYFTSSTFYRGCFSANLKFLFLSSSGWAFGFDGSFRGSCQRSIQIPPCGPLILQLLQQTYFRPPSAICRQVIALGARFSFECLGYLLFAEWRASSLCLPLLLLFLFTFPVPCCSLPSLIPVSEVFAVKFGQTVH